MPTSGQVAIIMRTKDRPLLLERAIQSVVGQNFQDWVLSIVNDGGASEPVDALIANYKGALQGRLVVNHNTTSRGMEAASNEAMGAVSSKFVVVHDDDDAWHPDFLAKTTDYLEARDLPRSVAGVVTNYTTITERIDVNQIYEESRQDTGETKEISLWNICAHNLYPPISFLYSRYALDRVGCYREDLPVLGDWEFNIRFLSHFDVLRLPGPPLAYYHVRSNTSHPNYANTVTSGVSLHQLHRTLIQNALLREDIAAGNIGLGWALSIAGQMYDIESLVIDTHCQVGALYGIRRRIDALLNPLRRLTGRGKERY